MKTKTPVVRQTSWLLTVPSLLVLGLLVALSAALLWNEFGISSVSIGALIYLAYAYSSRSLLLKHHRQGLALTHQGNYEDAIKAFERSYAFFSRHLWIDRFRYLTMMMPSYQTYREMALINIAYCYSQLGDKERTKAYYQRTLQEFPDSSMARTALNFIQTVETES